jgi:hypothetical protein
VAIKRTLSLFNAQMNITSFSYAGKTLEMENIDTVDTSQGKQGKTREKETETVG